MNVLLAITAQDLDPCVQTTASKGKTIVCYYPFCKDTATYRKYVYVKQENETSVKINSVISKLNENNN